jgi:hypothetical protein
MNRDPARQPAYHVNHHVGGAHGKIAERKQLAQPIPITKQSTIGGVAEVIVEQIHSDKSAALSHPCCRNQRLSIVALADQDGITGLGRGLESANFLKSKLYAAVRQL